MFFVGTTAFSQIPTEEPWDGDYCPTVVGIQGPDFNCPPLPSPAPSGLQSYYYPSPPGPWEQGDNGSDSNDGLAGKGAWILVIIDGTPFWFWDPDWQG